MGQSGWISSGKDSDRWQEQSLWVSPAQKWSMHLENKWGITGGVWNIWLLYLFSLHYRLKYLFLGKEVKPLKRYFVSESSQAEGEFLTKLCPSSCSLTMKYNTFNSWEPHGEKEKRVIAVTAVSSKVGTATLISSLVLGMHISRTSIWVSPLHLHFCTTSQ